MLACGGEFGQGIRGNSGEERIAGYDPFKVCTHFIRDDVGRVIPPLPSICERLEPVGPMVADDAR
jgi:hypothetical protein